MDEPDLGNPVYEPPLYVAFDDSDAVYRLTPHPEKRDRLLRELADHLREAGFGLVDYDNPLTQRLDRLVVVRWALPMADTAMATVTAVRDATGTWSYRPFRSEGADHELDVGNLPAVVQAIERLLGPAQPDHRGE